MRKSWVRRVIWKPLGAGVLVLLPVGLVVGVLVLLFRFSDGILSPLLYSAIHLIGRVTGVSLLKDLYIPGLGLGVLLFLLYGAGCIYLSRIGKWVVQKVEFLFRRLPLLGSIYSGSKILVSTLFGSEGKDKRIPVLVETQPGQMVIGFQTGKTTIQEKGDHQTFIAVYIPTTPNPTSGSLMFFPSQQVRPLDMSIEEAMRLILSGGLTVPQMLKS